MTNRSEQTPAHSQTARRTLVKGAAWATPAVAMAFAAPAFAASPSPKYRLRASHYYQRSCYQNNIGMRMTNQVQVGTSPLGFTVVNDPMDDGTTSPATTITIQSLTFTIGIPEVYINPNYFSSPFVFQRGTGANWRLQSATRQYMNGQQYRVYTFTFTGPNTNTSVTNGNSPKPWPSSAFDAYLRYSSNMCNHPLYEIWSGYTATMTAANGGTINANTLPPQWVTMIAT